MPAVIPKFSFPVPANKNGQAFGSAEELLAKLGGESSGQYLVGSQGMWHGGIHITEETIPWCALSTDSEAEKAFCNNQPYKGEQFIRCMADGEIVAYRVCKDYDSAAISWNDGRLHMSDSFVLVKHYIQPGETTASGLTFYTLYMHLAPLSAYVPPGGERVRRVVTAQNYYTSAEDVTAKPAKPAGVLAAGTVVTLSDSIISRESDTRQFTEVTLSVETKNTAGTILAAGTKIWTVSDRGSLASSATAPQPSWWAKCDPAYGAKSSGQVRATPRTAVKYYLSSDDVQKGTSPGTLQAEFPLRFEPGNVAQQTTRAIMKPGSKPPIPSGEVNTFSLVTLGKDAGKLKKGDRVWVVSDADFLTVSTPPAPGAQPTFGSVVKPATAIPVKAGESIGHLGFHELPTENGKKSRYQVHIECLSMDDAAKFIGNPEHAGEAKPAFLKFKPESTLFDKNEAGELAAGERKTKSGGIVTLAKVPVVKEGDQPKYYQIRQEGGWIAAADAQLISQYALAERGFAALNKSSASFDLIDGKLQPDNIVKEILQQLEAAAKADTRPGYALNQYNYLRLLAKIDSNNDGTYSIGEYMQALSNVSYRDRLQRIIARHPSEWYYGKDDPMWKTYLDSLKDEHAKWKTYLETFIEKMTWMKQVPGMGPDPWHMHPVVLVDSLTQKTSGSISCSSCQSGIEISSELLIHCFGISTEQAEIYAPLMTTSFAKYEIDNCLRISHFLGQIGVETQMLTKLREGFYYKDGDRLWKIYYTQLNLGLTKRFPNFTEEQRKQYTKDHLVKNEDELAKTLFPSDFEGMDYRGRGLIHLTHEGTYKSYKGYSKNDVVSNPKLLEESPSLAVDSACWFWSKFAKINTLADLDDLGALTHKVNAARLDMPKRGLIQKKALAYLKDRITGCIK